jgi:hypothetical protein
MIRNVLFILSHQDDEMGIFNKIKFNVSKKKNVLVFYMTSGYNKSVSKYKLTKRDYESISVLKELGVNKKNIFFLGRKNDIKVYQLYKHLHVSYKAILSIIKNLKGNSIIYSHSWEGGNEDHDSCHSIMKKLFLKNNTIKKCYQFSLYHGNNMRFKFFKVQDLFEKNGKIIKDKISFSEKINFLSYLFYYKTQIKVWVGLYPFIILNIILNNYGFVQVINKKMKLQRPHKNKLLYEKMRKNKYSKIINKINHFLK